MQSKLRHSQCKSYNVLLVLSPDTICVQYVMSHTCGRTHWTYLVPRKSGEAYVISVTTSHAGVVGYAEFCRGN